MSKDILLAVFGLHALSISESMRLTSLLFGISINSEAENEHASSSDTQLEARTMPAAKAITRSAISKSQQSGERGLAIDRQLAIK
jgi:hypothetical protein